MRSRGQSSRTGIPRSRLWSGSGPARFSSRCSGQKSATPKLWSKLANSAIPSIVPGREVIGNIAAVGDGEEGWKVENRVGGPWCGGVNGICKQCQ